MGKTVRALIVRSTGSWYQARMVEDGLSVECRLSGKIRQGDLKTTNPVAVGDWVELLQKNDEWIIKNILPRKNYIARQSPRKKHDIHLLASNVDQAILVVTMINPDLKPGFIDRFLLMTEPREIPAILVFNKRDLYTDEVLDYYEYISSVYESIGYPCLMTSAITGEGIDRLKEILTNKRSLMAGQSGVGKSSLINQLDPTVKLRVGELSDYSGKGQHTTTFAELIQLPFGAEIIDTPGIKTLSFNNMDILDVVHNFREFFEKSTDCKFSNCTHRNEPGCAVKCAVEAGQISSLRYHSYIQILEEISDQNHWEKLNL